MSFIFLSYLIQLFTTTIIKLTSLGSLNFQGAFTGVCSAQHVPSYKKNIDNFKAKGIDSVICVSVNDPYTMNGWAEKLEAKEAVSCSSCLVFIQKQIGHGIIELSIKKKHGEESTFFGLFHQSTFSSRR